MKARLCNKEDKETWVTLNKEYMTEELGQTDFWYETVDRAKQMLEKSFDDALEKEDAIKLVLFESNNAVVGFTNLTRFYSVWSSGDALLIDDLFIAKDFRDFGLEEEAMVIIEEFAKENDFRRIQFHKDLTGPLDEEIYIEAGYKPLELKFFMKTI